MGLDYHQFSSKSGILQYKWLQIAIMSYRFFLLMLANTEVNAVECAHRLRGGAAR